MSLPPTRQLEAFLAVAEARSFKLAADRLGMSQPALSQNIAQLEAYLKTALFIRTTRFVRLTAEGAQLQEQLTKLLPSLQMALDRARDMGKDSEVTVRLGFLASAAVKYLPRALTQFRARYPEVLLHARDDTAEGLFNAIHHGELDLAVSSYLPHKSKDVTFELFRADPLMAVLRRDHPLASQKEVTWAELLRYDFIGANRGSGTRFATDEAMQSINHPSRTVMDFNHFLAVEGMIEAGLGVSALPQVNCPRPDHPSLCIRRLVAPVVTRDLGVLTRNLDGSGTKHIRYFRDCIVAASVAAHADEGTPAAAPAL